MRYPINKCVAIIIMPLLVFLSSPTKALTIADGPLYLSVSADANLMFILDDSGSMQWDFMPDHTQFFTIYTFPVPAGNYGGNSYTNQVPDHNDNNLHNFFSRSSANNAVFYNPDITYEPWIANNGTVMADANPDCPLFNPVLPEKGCLAITTEVTQYALWFWNLSNQNQSMAFGSWSNQTYWPISYYNYTGGDRLLRSSYTRTRITSATPASQIFTSPGGVERSRDEEIQNFANWFQFYRSRILAARAGIGRAFSTQSTNLRVGFGAINTGALTIDGQASSSTIVRGVRPFSGTHRSDFYDRLYNQPLNGEGTPLRRSLNQAGAYYSRADDSGPWGANPGSNTTTAHLECRQAYTILMTDGFWNGPNPSVGNADNVSGDSIANPTTGDSYQYAPTDPYRDNWSNTLADVAMHYWKTDLRTLANKVPVTPDNPAFWQHMVTFGVGLGVQGTIDPVAAWDAVDHETPINWADPALNNPAKLDDLLHASINGRGGFFSAADPATFASELSSILNVIAERTESSAAAVTTNSTRLDANSVVYQAKFDSRNWTGQLLAFTVNSNGSFSESPAWNAGQKLTQQDTRNLFSFNTTTQQGVEFYHGNVISSLSEDKINYLRGDQSNEQPIGIFRKRTGTYAIMGDIVNSDPWFIGNTNFGYHLLKPNTDGTPTQEAIDYVSYRSSTAYRQRKPLVVVGANDGFLHAFDARISGEGSGNEVFAYAPHTLLNAMDALTNPDYTHKYFVDGPPVAADAYFDADDDGDNEWRTVTVGTLGAGGKGIFALDTTFLSPNDNTYATPETSFSANRVLWEINGSNPDFSELGFTIGQASIVRMANGDYAAVFGNGYNSTSHKAILYVVNIKTGQLIRAITTNVGSSTANNGLSTPITVDVNGDRTVDAVYAGDVQGNLWKFDVSSSNPAQWAVAFKSGSTLTPLYRARSSSNAVQPITAKPQVGKHPSGGVMVYFGTGKYFETGDHTVGSSPLLHTFYGIRDACVKAAGETGSCSSTFPNTTRGTHLVAQSILLEDGFIMPDADEAEVDAQNIRVTSSNAVDYTTKRGWYMDLVVPTNSTGMGERVISHALLRGGRIIFTTLIPDSNPCSSGGTSWLMELDSLTGKRLIKSPFDLTGNNLINNEDMVSLLLLDSVYSLNQDDGTRTAVSGVQSNVGIIKTPGVISAGDIEYKYTNGSTSAMEVVTESVNGASGRQSWWQIM